MADKMTGKKPKKVRTATPVAEGAQKGGEVTGPKREAEQGRKKK